MEKTSLHFFLTSLAIGLVINSVKATSWDTNWISDGIPVHVVEDRFDEQASISENFYYVDGYTVDSPNRLVIDPLDQKNGSFVSKNDALTYETTSISKNFAPVYFYKNVFSTTKSATVLVRAHIDSSLATPNGLSYYLKLALAGATLNQNGQMLPDYSGNRSIQVALKRQDGVNSVAIYGYDGLTHNLRPDATAPNSNLQDVTLMLNYDAPSGLVYASYFLPSDPYTSIPVGQPYDFSKYLSSTIPYFGFWITAGNYTTNQTVDQVGPGKITFSYFVLNEWTEPIPVSIPQNSVAQSVSKKKIGKKSAVKKKSATKKKSSKKRK